MAQCIQLELVNLISNDDCQVSNMQVYLNRGVQATTYLWSSDVWAKLYSIFYMKIYTEREREGERDQLYSAASLSAGLGHCPDSLVHLLCNFGRDPGA